MIRSIFGIVSTACCAIGWCLTLSADDVTGSSPRDAGTRIAIETVDVFDALVPLVERGASNTTSGDEPEIRRDLGEVDETVTTTSDSALVDSPPVNAVIDPRPGMEMPTPGIAPRTNTVAQQHSAENRTDGRSTEDASDTVVSPNVRSVLNATSQNLAWIAPQLTALSTSELQALIKLNAGALSSELKQVHYGDRWMDYLHLAELPAAMEVPQTPEQAKQQQDFLRALKESYDDLSRDRQFQAIADRKSFIVLHRTLAEYLASGKANDDRKHAWQDVEKLLQSLQPLPTGGQWMEYFEIQRVAHLLTSPEELTRDEKGQMQLILARFETAAVEPRFAAVAKLPGFAQTHRRLQGAAIVPDVETPAVAESPLPGTPVPDGEGPIVMLVAEQGLAFVRTPGAPKWTLVEKSQSVPAGSLIRVGENGVARLVIGSSTQVFCSADTAMHVRQFVDDNRRIVTQLKLERGNVKVASNKQADLSPEPLAAHVNQQLQIVYGGHQLVPADGDLELNLQHDAQSQRVIASVYRGAVAVRHGAGDEVTLRPGREAVMLRAGIAIRSAAAKPQNWWPTRNAETATTADDGFSR
mgnify:FL=1